MHYRSKDELLLGAYLEMRAELGEAAISAIDTSTPPRERFLAMWVAIYRLLEAEPERASFLRQVDS